MKVALVHDYLTQFGGAEQVLAELVAMYPDAPILTSLHNSEIEIPGVGADQIVESLLGRISGLRDNHRIATPVYPLAMRQLGRRLREVDIIIADSSAWAHQVPVSDKQGLVVYCHSPARFLYGDSHYLDATRMRGSRARILHAGLKPYRWLDKRSYRRADVVLANSGVVARRLAESVGVHAEVVYPPIDTEFFTPTALDVPREPFLLVVSRLVAHKRIDLVVETATRFSLPLKVIGTGRDRARLAAMAGPTVEFMGFQTRESVRSHFQRCRAFVLPGVEDFGMTAVEAQASGAPVIAFNQGGATESVIHGKTGWLFDAQEPESLFSSIKHNEVHPTNASDCIEQAGRFGIAPFRAGIERAVELAISTRGIR